MVVKSEYIPLVQTVAIEGSSESEKKGRLEAGDAGPCPDPRPGRNLVQTVLLCPGGRCVATQDDVSFG